MLDITQTHCKQMLLVVEGAGVKTVPLLQVWRTTEIERDHRSSKHLITILIYVLYSKADDTVNSWKINRNTIAFFIEIPLGNMIRLNDKRITQQEFQNFRNINSE